MPIPTVSIAIIYTGATAMSIYSNKHRKIWEKNYGPIPKDKHGRSLEIHHIDGNHSNNDIKNLQLVTIEEHYDIHYQQKDYGACILISYQRLYKSEEELKILHEKLGEHNKKILQQKVKDKKHHWTSEEHRKNSKILAEKRVKDGTNPFLWIGKEQIKNGTHNFQMKWICPNCKKEGTNQINLIRWHGEKCKLKIIQ